MADEGGRDEIGGRCCQGHSKSRWHGEFHASDMSKVGGTHKAADGTRMLNLGQQNVRFRTHEGHVCGLVFQIADVEGSLIAASQLAAAGNRAFKAQGGDVENIKTGWIEDDARAERRHLCLANVDRSACSFFFQGVRA